MMDEDARSLRSIFAGVDQRRCQSRWRMAHLACVARLRQRPLLRSVEFGAVEARANDVQFCLRERAFHAKDKAVVEVGRIVAAISVEHPGLFNALY